MIIAISAVVVDDMHTRVLIGISVRFYLVRFYRATVRNVTHGIAMSEMSVRLSVRLSDKHLHCDKTEEMCANILYRMKDRSS